MRPGEASIPVHPRFDRQTVRAEQGDAHGPLAVRRVKPSLWNGRAPSLSAASTPKTSESTWAGVSGTGG